MNGSNIDLAAVPEQEEVEAEGELLSAEGLQVKMEMILSGRAQMEQTRVMMSKLAGDGMHHMEFRGNLQIRPPCSRTLVH